MKKGETMSPEQRAKISAATKGREGRKLSAEERAHLSAAQTGRKRSPETRAKMSSAKRGPDYRAAGRYCIKVYENAWGLRPREASGRAYHIHHRDGNRQNDDPDNLIALTNSEHMTLERALEYGYWDWAAEIDAIGEGRRHARHT